MVVEGILVNESVGFLLERVYTLLPLIKAIGVITFIYILYLVLNGVFRWKDRKRLKRLEKKMDELLYILGSRKKETVKIKKDTKKK